MDPRPKQPIRLFVYGTGWGIPFPTSAPFPLKLATWLRMAELPFEFVIENNAGKGPKGKSPWIEYESIRMGDSTMIIEHLRRRFGIDLDQGLSLQQRALALSVQRMLEEHYHQSFEHQLFFGRGGKARMSELAGQLPIPLRWIVPTVFLRALGKQLHARGVARHAEEEIIAQGTQDLDALSGLLGDRPFFHGDKPSTIDACIFGFLGVSVYVAGDNPLFRHAASLENLVRYCERMRRRYFPESLEQLPALFPNEPPTESSVRKSHAA